MAKSNFPTNDKPALVVTMPGTRKPKTMKTFIRFAAALALIGGLTGFSDPSGYYTLDIPQNWEFYKKIEDSDIVYCPNGDPRRGSLDLSRTAQAHGKNLHDEANWHAKYGNQKILSQEKVTVAGRDCLHAVFESKNNKGERLLTHMLICDVTDKPYPNATGVFTVDVVDLPGSGGINGESIFWAVVRSIKFTKAPVH